ncbi:MAG: GntR family transcriptional regulator [Peptococcaceae bacterium]|nr:GntR family transcriptional regulator [Peptococcaceae bacterium]
MIASTLEMSRTPIREALRVLASEGLVEIYNGVGVFVKHITTKEICELFEVRAALECIALRTSLTNITDEEIEQLERDWQKLKEKADNGLEIGLDTIAHYDHKLHSLIVDKCNNSFIKNIVRSIRQSILRYQRLSAKALADEKETISQHLEIISLLKERKADRVIPVLERHIQEAADNIAKKM